jgi:hypothetical protein
MDKSWIKLEDKKPKVGEDVLVILDYTKWGREKRGTIAHVHYTPGEVAYGGPRSLTGAGLLTGYYFSIPSIPAPGVVTHWCPLPEID